jgi:hypothetical protein
MINGEQILWRAVILRALRDSTNKKLSKEERIEAQQWLNNGGLDFKSVCRFADVNSDLLREKFLKSRLTKKGGENGIV